MKLRLKKWVLICLIVFILLPISFSIIHFLITKKPNYLLAHLTEIVRQENYGKIGKLNLPVFQLKLNEDDIAHFEDLYKDYRQFQDSGEEWFEKDFLPYYNHNNKWLKATLVVNNKEYLVKVKSHGLSPVGHKYGKYFSIKIKLLKNQKIFNVTSFRLIIYRRVFYDYDLLQTLVEGTNLIFQRDKLILFSINEWDSKLFYFENNVENEFLASMGLSNKIILKAQPYKSLIFSGGDTAIFYTQLKNMFSKTYYKYNKFYNDYFNFNKAITNKSLNEIEKFIDTEYITTFNALRLFMRGNAHGIIETNLLVCYDTLNRKFYPIFHRDFTWNRPSDNPHLQANSWDSSNSSCLFMALDANETLRLITYKKLYNYISKNNNNAFKSQIDSIVKFHESLHYSSYFKSLIGFENKEFFSDNIQFYNLFFNNIQIDINKKQSNDTLIFELSSNSKSFLILSNIFNYNLFDGSESSAEVSLECIDKDIITNIIKTKVDLLKKDTAYIKKLREIYLINILNTNSLWEKRKYVIKIYSEDISDLSNKIQLSFKNIITETEIPDSNISYINFN